MGAIDIALSNGRNYVMEDVDSDDYNDLIAELAKIGNYLEWDCDGDMGLIIRKSTIDIVEYNA